MVIVLLVHVCKGMNQQDEAQGDVCQSHTSISLEDNKTLAGYSQTFAPNNDAKVLPGFDVN